MKSDYKKQIEIIKDCKFLQSLNVCDFSHFVNANHFEYIYEHISKIFRSESLKYSIPNPVFLFSDCSTLNAGAKLKDEIGLIIFNKGLVLISINEILENERLKEFNKSFSKTSEHLNISIEELIYQFIYLFTFYHEFAHLLQNNDYHVNMSEENNVLSKNVLESHYKELDADAYSSVHLARHINEYCVNKFDVTILKNVIIGITAIFCSNLLYQLMRFPSANKELYFEKNSHPHSFIRILNIIANISRYINLDENLIKRGIIISKEDLFKPIVDEITRLQDVYQNENIEEFRESVVNEIEKITIYITKVSKNKPSNINSALDVYNNHIKKT